MPANSRDLHVRADHELTTLGAVVRARRRDLGLRQDELADLAGVSERFVHAVETGKPTVQLDKVLDVLRAVGLHLQLHRGSADTITTAHVVGPRTSP
ncbi:MAG: helix-turn-helix transcriptional regulator [Geodermatophilaceae bacterium]|nr:helix-turn-helix transcriptional regulator [Geodermatophilaceae bacterium]